MLISRAGIQGAGVADLRIEQGVITAIGQLQPRPGEGLFDQRGGAALPGLNDHHMHLMAYAAALESVSCGPPEVDSPGRLIEALSRARPGAQGWIRGFRYHESVAGDIDRQWLDRHAPNLPIRIQHRSGRLWILNSAGLGRLDMRGSRGSLAGVESGRFFDQDRALGRLWGHTAPPVAAASRRLASYGVTGLTDLTPPNDDAAAARLGRLRDTGDLLQAVRVGGVLEMSLAGGGPTKVHLHEATLPRFDSLCGLIGASHARHREVAVHCVTEAELVFALAAFREAGTCGRDRIEHASVTPSALLGQIRELGLLVVTQPHFVAERGDAYLRDVPQQDHPHLYRCGSFLDSAIPLAAGSDAPFGTADPWRAMQAAVDRRTASGQVLGSRERITPEQALSLYLGSLDEPQSPRRIEVGAAADLCLLDRPWAEARRQLASVCVRATLRAGGLIYSRERSHPGAPGR